MEALESELTCPVCLDLFEEPVLLPCLHCLCRKCADILNSVTKKEAEEGTGQAAAGKKEPPGQPKEAKLTCPTCRKEIPLDERGVDGLSKNVMLQNVVDRFRDARDKENPDTAPPCQICEGDPRPATKVCVNCDGLAYCEACLTTFHPARGAFAQHTLVPPGQQPDKAESKVVMCTDHADEKVNMYCEVDEMPICSLCKLVGQHQGHMVIALSDAYKEKRDILMKEFSAFKERNKEIGDFVEGMRETCAKVQDKSREWQDKLVRDVTRLEEILKERKEFLTAALIEEEEGKLTLLNEEIAKKEAHLHEAQAVAAYVEEVLKEKDQPCFLQAMKSIRERLAKSQHKDALVVPTDLIFKGFDFNQQLEVMKAMNMNEFSTSWKECVEKLSTSSYRKTGSGKDVRHFDGDKLVDGDHKTYWQSDNRDQTKHWLRLVLKPYVQARTFRLSLVDAPQFPFMLFNLARGRKPDKVTILAGNDFDNMTVLETVHIGKEQREITINADTEKRFLQLTFEMETPSDCIVSQISIVASKVPTARARGGCVIQ